MATPTAMEPAMRKKVLRVVFISLLLDLISFTFILPLFPKLLEFYRNLEASNANSNTLLAAILHYLNAYKNSFSKTIDARYDIVLLGGALGSLFSLLQALASPLIGSLSDRYGRRRALLISMCGNILSVLLWVCATDFRTFLASRVVGGLSEGNVQIATAIAADISTPGQRGGTMALVGVCFSIAFTFGPALGAWLSTVEAVGANPFAVAAGVSLLLIVVETLYLYVALPETLPAIVGGERAREKASGKKSAEIDDVKTVRTNSHALLNLAHFTFILFFSGMEFSLPFMTYDLFGYSAPQNGRMLGFMGLIASVLQGGVTRRLPPLTSVRVGVVTCLLSFLMLSNISTTKGLYGAASLLAVTTATVVSGLNALSSLEAGPNERGEVLGRLRSWGQLGRGLGPLAFCSLYWWAGRETAFLVGGSGMAAVAVLVMLSLKTPKTAGGKKVKVGDVKGAVEAEL